MTELEALLSDLAADGLLINNLYQIGPTGWRASLRRDDGLCSDPVLTCDQPSSGAWCDHCLRSTTGYAYGEGPSVYYALIAALANVSAQDAKTKHIPAQVSSEQIGAGFGPKPKLSGVQLLRKLGL